MCVSKRTADLPRITSLVHGSRVLIQASLNLSPGFSHPLLQITKLVVFKHENTGGIVKSQKAGLHLQIVVRVGRGLRICIFSKSPDENADAGPGITL